MKNIKIIDAVLATVLALSPSVGTAIAGDVLEGVVSRSTGSDDYKEAIDRYVNGELYKIVGGQPADPGQFPWQVSLGVSWIASPARAHFCGGSIYSSTWIVTAAHCLVRNRPEDVIVTAGTVDLNSGGQRVNVRRILIKDGYSNASNGSDVALMELMEPLKMGPQVKGISLLSEEEATVLNEDAVLTTSGFGALFQGGNVVSRLQFVDVPFVITEICNAPQSYDGDITEDMICAGQAEGGIDSCQGDSGGPLVLGAGTNPVLAGIASWGIGCGEPLKFGVYTRVATYVDWIDACVSGRSECTLKP